MQAITAVQNGDSGRMHAARMNVRYNFSVSNMHWYLNDGLLLPVMKLHWLVERPNIADAHGYDLRRDLSGRFQSGGILVHSQVIADVYWWQPSGMAMIDERSKFSYSY